MRLRLFVILFCCSLGVQAQKEGHTWRFGNGLGIDFNTCPPTPLYEGAEETVENACSISDPKTGKLLFYTNSLHVYDRNHKIMPNGDSLVYTLNGIPATAISQVTIVPHPDSPNIFYIFTCQPQSSGSEPFQYHIVDMKQNGGLGDVVTRNISLLTGPVNEKVTAIRSADKKSFWVITHGFNNNTFYAFKIDKNGLNTTPVTSSIGKVINQPCRNNGADKGSIVASPDGKTLAYLNLCDLDFQLFRFDFGTGLISNYLNIKDSPNQTNPSANPKAWGGFYGASFSPNSNLLYISTMSGAYDQFSDIYQYDITSWDTYTIERAVQFAGRATFYHDSNDVLITPSFKQLKLAPDGKIYVGVNCSYMRLDRARSPHAVTLCMPVIEFPDRKGQSCKMNYCGFTFNPASAGKTYKHFPANPVLDTLEVWGLNNLFETEINPVSDLKIPGKKDSFYCQLITLQALSKPNIKVDKFRWSIQDSINNNIQVSRDRPYYWIDQQTKCGIVRDSFVMLPRKYKKGRDTSTCLGDGKTLYIISDTTGMQSTRWNDGSKGHNLKVSQTGIYSVSIIRNCDSIVDVWTITGKQKKPGKKTRICIGNGQILKPASSQTGVTTYSWSNGHDQPDLTVNAPGTYWLDISSGCDIIRDSFIVVPRQAVRGSYKAVCLGTGATLSAITYAPGNQGYRWSTSETIPFIQVSKAGGYWVDVFFDCTSVRDTFDVLPRKSVTGLSKSLCLGKGKILTPLTDTSKVQGYKWNTSDTIDHIKADKTGIYWLDMLFGCSVIRDSFTLLPRQRKMGMIGRACPGQILQAMSPANDSSLFLWNTGNLEPTLKNPKINTPYWVDISSDCYIVRDSFEISSERKYGLFTASDTSFCGRSVNYHLAFDTSLYHVNWKHGPNTNNIVLGNAGYYPFRIISKDQCFWDSGAVKVKKLDNLPVFIENAFTPDGNGHNELFPVGDFFDQVTIERFEVYNRWGNLLYSGTEKRWDGTYKGEACEEGIYVCRIVFKNCDYITDHFYGTITLLR